MECVRTVEEEYKRDGEEEEKERVTEEQMDGFRALQRWREAIKSEKMEIKQKERDVWKFKTEKSLRRHFFGYSTS